MVFCIPPVNRTVFLKHQVIVSFFDFTCVAVCKRYELDGTLMYTLYEIDLVESTAFPTIDMSQSASKGIDARRIVYANIQTSFRCSPKYPSRVVMQVYPYFSVIFLRLNMEGNVVQHQYIVEYEYSA